MPEDPSTPSTAPAPPGGAPTRRRLLRAAAVGALGLAALGTLAACGGEGEGGDDQENGDGESEEEEDD